MTTPIEESEQYYDLLPDMQVRYDDERNMLVAQQHDGTLIQEIPFDTEEEARQYVEDYRDERASKHTALMNAAKSALADNAQQTKQNGAIITACADIEAFAGTSLTMAQMIMTLKELATGIRILAEHDQSTKAQLNGLIRIVIGEVDDTPGTVE